MAVEPYEKTRFSAEMRFRPTFTGKGSGVAVAIRNHTSYSYGDWTPDIVSVGHIAPYDEAIADENRRRQETEQRQIQEAEAQAAHVAELREAERVNRERREEAEQWCLDVLPMLTRALQHESPLIPSSPADFVTIQRDDLATLIGLAIQAREFVL